MHIFTDCPKSYSISATGYINQYSVQIYVSLNKFSHHKGDEKDTDIKVYKAASFISECYDSSLYCFDSHHFRLCTNTFLISDNPTHSTGFINTL